MTSSYFRNLMLLALLLIFVCNADHGADHSDDDYGPDPEPSEEPA